MPGNAIGYLQSCKTCYLVSHPHTRCAFLSYLLPASFPPPCAQIMTGTGGTGFYPSAVSDVETAIVTILDALAAFIWTAVLAMFCDVATNSSPALTQFRQQLDALNFYVHAHDVPSEMARRLRSYLHQSKGIMLRKDANASLAALSSPLQIELMLHVHSKWMQSIWFIKDLGMTVQVQLALSMTERLLSPGEVAPQRHLYIISRGSVLFGGRVLVRSMSWGDDIILTDDRYFLPYSARAITYVDALSISRDVLMDAVEGDYEAKRSLRKHQLKLALRREIVVRAREVRRQLSEAGFNVSDTQNGLPPPGSGLGFIDRVQLAISNQSETTTKSMQVAVALQASQADVMSSSFSTAVPGRSGPSGGAGEGLQDTLEYLLTAQAQQQVAIHEMAQQLTAIADHLGVHSPKGRKEEGSWSMSSALWA